MASYKTRLLHLQGTTCLEDVHDRIICQDVFEVLDWLPPGSVDLLFADPPYNLAKTFNGRAFSELSATDYELWLDSWIKKLPRLLKPNGSLYICGDWRSSTSIHKVVQNYFVVQNRITWEREKGRGARHNWKNCAEDIWFCTVSNQYTFNVEDVRLKRRVLAPYTEDGTPKDWDETGNGRYRLTYPSNIWTDLTVPFWSMPENTDHPTQKPEKLLAKVILASSNPGDIVFDPFLGSGTTAVVAKKLGRHFIGVEIDELYGCLAEKRLELANGDKTIQGYSDSVFWERNTLSEQSKPTQPASKQQNVKQPSLF
ncbi:MAG: site-specific DNA-methyltransferase [Chloroflexi bacterium]|nr:site-specific DNA-methyltransferase [Ardenticatenaceae bacterium]MBL1128800.1 site-specific DNA-methyltransferase [Chloroflexota bacterium]NOG34878.1 site-specific DNA-methyltransferase [Chloroflexota bacterium]